MEKILTVDDVIKEDKDPDTGVSNYTYTNGELDNRVVITNDSGVVDYSLIEMTVEGGEGNENLLVATDEVGQIDNSFLKSTNTKKANSVVITNSVGVIDYNLLKASTSPTSYSLPATNRTNITYNSSTNKGGFIPVTNADNKLDNGWLNTAKTVKASDKLVVTDGTGTINNNLINWTTGYATNITDDKGNKDKLVKTSINTGKIDDSLLKTTVTSEPDTIVKLDENGLLDKSIFRDDQFIPLTGGEPSGSIIIQGPQKANEADSETISLETLNEIMPEFYGFGANTHGDGFLIGMNGSSDQYNGLIIATHDDYAAIKVRQYGGSNGYSGMTGGNAPASKEITLMDYSTGNTKLIKLTVDNDIVSSTGTLQIKGNGESSIAGKLTVSGGIVIPISGDTVSDTGAYGTAALTIGKNNSLRIEIDENEIGAKNSSNKPSGVGPNASGEALFLQPDGGLVKIGQRSKTNLHVNGNISTMNYNSDPGNNEASEGNLTIVGKSSLIKDVTIGNSSNKTSSLSVQGNITSENGVFTSKATTGTNILKSDLSVDGNVTVGSTGTNGKAGNVNIVNGKVLITTDNTVTNTLTTHVQGNMGTNDYWRLSAGNTGSDSGYLEISTGDNGTEPIYVKQYNASKGTSNDLTLLDKSGNTVLPGNLTLDSATGTITAYRAIFKSDLDAKASSNKEVALTVGGDGTAQHLEIDNNEIQSKATSTTIGNLSLNPDGGNVYIADNNGASGSVYIPNGDLEVGGSLSVGTSISAASLSTTGALTAGGAFTANSTSQFNGNVTIGKATSTKNLTVNGKTTSTTLSVSGNSTLSNGVTKDSNNNITARNYVTSGPIYIADGADLVATSYDANNRPHLTIGGYTGTHIEIDNNEISAKAKNSTTNVVEPYILYIQPDGGKVQIGSNAKADLLVKGASEFQDKVVLSNNGTTTSGRLVIQGTTDRISKTSSANAPLIIGSETGTHLAFDLDEISARSNGTGGKSTLYFQPDGGNVFIGEHAKSSLYIKNSGDLSVSGTSTLTGAVEAKSGIKVTGGVIDIYPNYDSVPSSGVACHITGHMAGSDDWRIAGGATASDSGFMEIAVADNGNENILFRKYKRNTVTNEHFDTVYQEIKLLDTNGDTSFPGNVNIGTVTAEGDVVKKSLTTTGNILLPYNGYIKFTDNEVTDHDNDNGEITMYTNINGNMGGNDFWRIASGTDILNPVSSNDSGRGVLEIAVSDDGAEEIVFRQYKGGTNTWDPTKIYRTAKILNADGNTEFPGKVTATGGVIIPITGDKVTISSTTAPLTIGSTDGIHMQVDQNEIQVYTKSGENKVSSRLYLQGDGGCVDIGHNVRTAEVDPSEPPLLVHGPILICENGGLKMSRTNGNGYTILKLSQGSVSSGDGDNALFVGAGDMTGIFSGDAYTNWWNYINGNIDTIRSENLWPVSKKTSNGVTTYYPEGLGGYSDSMYLISDQTVHIQTNVHDSSNSASGNAYKNRKDFKFDTDGNLSIPGSIFLGTSSIANPGYIKLGNLIIQWGKKACSSGTTIVTFPTPFSVDKKGNAYVYSLNVTYDDPGDTGGASDSPSINSYNDKNFTASTSTSYSNIFWIAIGK